MIAIAPAGIGDSYAIPDNVTKVSACFDDCDHLSVVRIPDSVIEIDELAFCCCFALHRILVSSEERIRYFKKRLDEESGELLTLE